MNSPLFVIVYVGLTSTNAVPPRSVITSLSVNEILNVSITLCLLDAYFTYFNVESWLLLVTSLTTPSSAVTVKLAISAKTIRVSSADTILSSTISTATKYLLLSELVIVNELAKVIALPLTVVSALLAAASVVDVFQAVIASANKVALILDANKAYLIVPDSKAVAPWMLRSVLTETFKA